MTTFTLTLDPTNCTLCGKCVDVCPSSIFTLIPGVPQVELHHIQDCIHCGHCIEVCPVALIKHSFFPPEKVHLIDRSQLPKPDQMMMLIKARRSNRAFSDTQVPEHLLNMILEAAHSAPTANNRQEVEFTLITKPEKLREIIQIAVDIFTEKVRRINNSIFKPVYRYTSPTRFKLACRLNALSQSVKRGKDPVLRGATALVLIHTPQENYFYDSADCNLAYQNGSLMAESLGVSQFYTGFLCRAIYEDKEKRINKALGIKGNIHAGMALGIPSFVYPAYVDKQKISVKKIV